AARAHVSHGSHALPHAISSPCWAPRLLPPFFFFNATAPPEIYTLSLHDALPISCAHAGDGCGRAIPTVRSRVPAPPAKSRRDCRSEEHTSELQSLTNIVCRLLLEKKKTPPGPRTAARSTQQVNHECTPNRSAAQT